MLAQTDPAPLGHNNPPEPSPFEAHRVNIEDLYAEAKNWLDGEPIASEAQADKVGELLDMIRQAHEAADAARKAENEPFDTGKAEVQARYAPLIADTKAVRGKTVLAREACLAALTPWRRAQQAIRDAEAAEARRVAEAAAQAAAAAVRAADTADLTAREDAERMVEDARRAEAAARRAAAPVATGLRRSWTPVLVDGVAAARHYWLTNRPACEAHYLELARADVLAGKRQIPGFEIEENRRAV